MRWRDREHSQALAQVAGDDPVIKRACTAEILAWGTGLAVKLFWRATDDALVETEARLTRAARDAGLPVPRVHGIACVAGRKGIVFDRLTGTTMTSMLKVRPWTAFSLARRMAELHRAVHSVRVPDLPPLHETLARRIGAAGGLDDSARRIALEALERLPRGDALCHGDFHTGNILMQPGGPIIVDWADAARGDPAADVARTLLLFQMMGEHRAGLSRFLRRMGCSLFSVIYLAHYQANCRANRGNGRGGEARMGRARITAWLLPVAAARLGQNEVSEHDALRLMIGRLVARHHDPASRPS